MSMGPNSSLIPSSMIILPWSKKQISWNSEQSWKIYNRKNALKRLTIVADIFDTVNHLPNLKAIKITLILWITRKHPSQLILEAYFQPPALWRIMCLSAHIKAWWIARLYSRNQTWSPKEATVFSGKYSAFSISEAFTNNTPHSLSVSANYPNIWSVRHILPLSFSCCIQYVVMAICIHI